MPPFDGRMRRARERQETSSTWPSPYAVGLLGMFPLFVFGFVLLVAWRTGNFALDFHYAYFEAGRALLNGESPYPVTSVVWERSHFVYPMTAAVVFVPFAVLPHLMGDILFTAISTICLFAGMRLVTKDWRILGALLLWPAVLIGVQTANLTLLLVLCVAVVWRYRESPWSGVVLGVAVALKPILWPMAIWMIARRRYRPAVVSGLVAGTLTGATFLAFGGFTQYVDVSRALAETLGPESYSLMALGIPGWAVAVPILLSCFFADDRRAFTLALAASLAISPIVYVHYLALLAVPLALAFPTFGPVWLLAIVAWLVPGSSNGELWQTCLVLALLAVMTAVALGRGERLGYRGSSAARAAGESGAEGFA